MTEAEYIKLSTDLQVLAREIPLHWGAVQNNLDDAAIDMFKIETYDHLELSLLGKSLALQHYLKRRWYLWRCAQCDEYLFYQHKEVARNPKLKDQLYDIEFFGRTTLQFDIKGTVIPKVFRSHQMLFNRAFCERLVGHFYEEQSKGRRNQIQNRLFIVHHSFRKPSRELFLRAHWGFKELAYQAYIRYIDNCNSFFNYQTVKADIILIIEQGDGKMRFEFGSAK